MSSLGNSFQGKGQNGFDLIGQSPKMKEVHRLIEKIAATDIPVVVCGESGTGKEVAARIIHAKSLRGQRPFLKVDCASIPHELLESELFGFERGSFTGAFSSKPGIFEMADRGTILLDEIGEMPMNLQPKLLQVLQDMQFSRLGAQREIAVDVRFISSTKRPFESLLAEGKFREDLFYRMNVITIQIPPLRERKADIPELARHLLRKHTATSKNISLELSDKILERFQEHDWPGNVRELENMIRHYAATGNSEKAFEHFPVGVPDRDSEVEDQDAEEAPVLSIKEAAKQAARQAEHDMILMALRKTNWNRKRAAAMLQISYKAMLYKLKDVGLGKHSQTV